MLSKVIAYITQSIVTRLLVETFLAVFRRISWGDVLARFGMRLIKSGLRRLAACTSNKVDDQLVEDIVASLERNDAPKV
jgi:uncharacterized membrane protein